MPTIFPVIKNVLSDAIEKAIASAQRYFLPFDPVLNSYAELDTAFKPAGDFEVEATVSTISSSDINIFSSTSVNDDEIRIDMNSAGTVRVFAYVATTLQTIITSTTTVNDGQLHTIKLTYTGTTAELFINGVSEGTATWSLNGSQEITSVGRVQGGYGYFDGYIANVKLIDKTTASNSRIFPLAVGAGATENSTINSGSITINNIPDADRELFTFDSVNDWWVGEELVTNGTFDTDSNWTKESNWSIANGKATSSGATDTGRDLWQYSILEVDSRYKISVDIVDYVDGSLKFWAGSTTYSIGGGLGSYTFDQLYTNTALNINSGNVEPYFQGSIDNVSVKRVIEVR
jgi:hypothetical protein